MPTGVHLFYLCNVHQSPIDNVNKKGYGKDDLTVTK